MAVTQVEQNMRLHGEDGKVFVVDRNGVRLWEVVITDISVDQRFHDGTYIDITAMGGKV